MVAMSGDEEERFISKPAFFAAGKASNGVCEGGGLFILALKKDSGIVCVVDVEERGDEVVEEGPVMREPLRRRSSHVTIPPFSS